MDIWLWHGVARKHELDVLAIGDLILGRSNCPIEHGSNVTEWTIVAELGNVSSIGSRVSCTLVVISYNACLHVIGRIVAWFHPARVALVGSNPEVAIANDLIISLHNDVETLPDMDRDTVGPVRLDRYQVVLDDEKFMTVDREPKAAFERSVDKTHEIAFPGLESNVVRGWSLGGVGNA